MTHTPQDQGPGDGRDAARDAENGPGNGTGPDAGAGRDAAQGGSRRRTDAGYLGQNAAARSPQQEARETSYSESARYLDSAWQSSSGRPPAPTPYQGPTQVVPIQEIPSGPQARSAQPQSAGSHPAGPQPSDPTVVVPMPGASTGAGAGAASGRPEMDLGAYAMGGAQPNPGGRAGPGGDGFGAGGHGGHGNGPDGPSGHDGDGDGDGDGGDSHGNGRGKRRRALVIWGVVGAVTLTGAGLVAANTLGGDDKKTTTSVGLTTSPTPSPAAPSTAPPSTDSGPPSTSASGKAPTSGQPSGSKSPSGSPSGSASTGGKTPNVDSDDDGIADDPGATDPSKLVGGARTAYQQAKQAMAAEGITMTLTSGKRSYEHQRDLFEKEVREKGSTAAARMRVLPPDESSHVDGNAIDINVAAQPWMKSKGRQFGWCQIYANEPWHFEYQASYKTGSCPALKPHP